jgi:NTP pyrophosphatase (non-canonical NTP hydrolase)
MKYHIYHIPGRKIGVTTNLKRRVEEAQGHSSEEYEVLETSEDIEYVTKQERVLQKQYGYKVDRTPYKDYIKKYKRNKTKEMNINVTDQTTTFPCALEHLKVILPKMLGRTWDTPLDGKLSVFTPEDMEWISSNAMTSTFRETRCFIYNKAFARHLSKGKATIGHNVDLEKDINPLLRREPFSLSSNTTVPMPSIDDDENMARFHLIREWAQHRGLYVSGDTKTQFVKLMEESGELARGILKNDTPEIVDAIGDMVVVLTNLAALSGVTIEHCIDSAYDVISSRTGKMVDGTFVKDE